MATTEIYTLSLHDALPIYSPVVAKVIDLRILELVQQGAIGRVGVEPYIVYLGLSRDGHIVRAHVILKVLVVVAENVRQGPAVVRHVNLQVARLVDVEPRGLIAQSLSNLRRLGLALHA